MRLKKPLRAKCNSCGTVFEMDIEFECVSTNERNMGTEFVYEGVEDGRCPNCGKDIYIKIESCEYPIGTVSNSEEQIVDGMEIVSEIELIPEI